jgi:uncharacterized protein
MSLKQIVLDQRQELDEEIQMKHLVSRTAEVKSNTVLKSKLVKVITGIRRCGKSVLIYKLLKDKNFAYVNFDDDRLLGIKSDEILPAFYEVYGKKFKIIFLDEVQNLDNWELLANRLHRTGFNVFITGSNSNLLSKELATHLTGRHVTIELFPFSFREYLNTVGFNENIETTRGISITKRELKKYLENSGFPEISVEKEDPSVYLRQLFRTILERDIIQRYDIVHKRTFKEIAMSLLSNPARLISYNKIKKQFSLGSDHTAKNYIEYLEEAYLIFIVSKFSRKPVEIERSEKKIYSIDAGVPKNLGVKLTRDDGPLYENLVACELFRQKSSNSNMEIYYWKDVQQHEVDFVIKQGLKIKTLIQVCYNLTVPKVKKREINALVAASKELKCDNLFVVTDNYEGKEKIKGKTINYVPLWKWLLQKEQY